MTRTAAAKTHARRAISAACGVVGILLILVAFLLGYATRSLFSERAFAYRVAASLEDPRLAGFVAERITDAVIQAKPDLVGLRPVLVGAARSVVSSLPFRAAVRRSARTLHRAIMSGAGKNIVLGVQDVGVLIESMAHTNPGLAGKIPAGVSAALERFGALPGGERAARLIQFANRMRIGTLVLLVLGIALCVVSVRLSHGRRRAIMRIGIALAVIGVVLGIAARFGSHTLPWFIHNPDYAPALVGLGSAFLRGLLYWAIALVFAGLVVAAASAALLERVPLKRWGLATQRWFLGPQERMRLRLARGVVMATAGTGLLFQPMAALTVVSWLSGAVIAFVGLREAFIAALHLLPVEEPVRGVPRTAPRRRAFALAGSMATVLLAGTAWLILRSDATPIEHHAATTCNGSARLCDRTLDQVMFPTAHNAMGGADVPGWMFPSQGAGIAHQLQDGIRGLLIDVHYGNPVRDKVKTDLTDEAAAMAKYERSLGHEGMAAVLRIRDRMAGEKLGDRDIYMCHGFCELGALKFADVLTQIREFLVAHPGEVLVIVIQDESVTAADVERVFEETGLADFVYLGPARPPWPTLREMVETDQRVLVMAENAGDSLGWYHPAFDVLQETPYEFHDTTQFSNAPNRGGTSGSLAMLNHWIETTPMPKPSNAAIVNERGALMRRIRAFQKERGRLPNLVAVDFYGVGDLVSVVREMNEQPWPAVVRRSGRGVASRGP